MVGIVAGGKDLAFEALHGNLTALLVDHRHLRNDVALCHGLLSLLNVRSGTAIDTMHGAGNVTCPL